MGIAKRLRHETRRLSVLATRPGRVTAWVALNLLLFAALAGALGYRSELKRQEAEDNLRTAAITLADSYSEQLARAVATVDEQTLTLKHYWEQDWFHVDLGAQWRSGLFGSETLNGISISDKEGQIVTSTFAEAPGTDISATPFFYDYRERNLTGLRITPPSDGKLSHKPTIRFLRDLRTSTGEFGGLIIISCPPTYFSSASGMSRLGPHDFLSIRDQNGTVYVRQVRDSISMAKTMFTHPGSLPLPRGFKEMAPEDFNDGVARYIAWAPVKGTHLVALAGLSLDDALVPYRESRREYHIWALAWICFLSAVCFGGLGLYGHLLLRAEDAERVKRTYRLATEVAGEGFYMLEPVTDARGQIVDFRILDCNALGARSMGFEASELIGKTIRGIQRGEYGTALVDLFKRGLNKGHEEAEVRIPSGSIYKAQWIYRKMVATEGSLAVTVVDISQKKQQEKALRETANTDSLTGLPNRHWLSDYLPQSLESAKKANSVVALFFIDLDNFKDVNDTLGHLAGDQVLKTTAERLSAAVRPGDRVVRLGGDEFTVLIEGVADKHGLKVFADRIVRELSKPLLIDGQPISTVGGSVGIARYPENARDADGLLRSADMAMYAAKSAGKTCYAFFSQEIGRVRSSRLEMERDLRESIDRGDFIVHYQPRVDVKRGKIVGAEALVRWCHPTKGLVQPNDFIPLAEQTGLILEIGEIVIDIVCGQIEKWQRESGLLVPISVNVSPIQFNRRDVAACVIAQVSRRKIPAHLLEIELTEAAMLDAGSVRKQFADLRDYGIKLLVDDFGTCYSSLAQMQHFRLDVLKVDQSLTAKLGKGPEGKVFYQAIVAMGHALNMTITAEGVETREQLDILGDLACDEIQGFLIAKPLNAECFQSFLSSFEQQDYRKGLLHTELE